MTCEHEALRAMHPQGWCVLCGDEPRGTKVAETLALLEGVSKDEICRAIWRKRAPKARASLAEFFKGGWHVTEPSTPLDWNWHLDELCTHVQRVIEDWAHKQKDPTHIQRVRDLLCTLGPGTGKSRVGVFAIPWAWLQWPGMRVIALSCNPRVALRDSDLTRQVIASEWYQHSFEPEWKIRDNADTKSAFINTAGGFRNAMGWSAKIVGERADLLWPDDPHDPDEVSSDAMRKSVLERWDAAIHDRTNDPNSSIRIGIAHRVHDEDWGAARIAEGWCELRLPTEFDARRPCRTPFGGDRRTVDGEVLHKSRMTPEWLLKKKATYGAIRWSALHNQDPSPAGGALIKTINLRFHAAAGMPDARSLRPPGCFEGPSVETPTTFDAVCIAADLAGGKETKAGDYNAIVAVGKRAARFYLLRAWRRRADFPAVQHEFRSFCNAYPLARKIVEAAAAGASLVSSLVNEIPGLVGRPAKGDKVSNMQAVLAFFDAANVFLDENHPELSVGYDGGAGLVGELITFGAGAKHDDFADALRIALAELGQMDAEEAERRGRLVRMALSAHEGKPGADAIAFVNGALTRAGQPHLSDGEIAASPRLSGAAGKRGGFGFSGFAIGRGVR